MRTRFVMRTNDSGCTTYQVKVGQLYIGSVVRIRPGVWMAEGCSLEFDTRREAGEYLRATP